MFSSPKGLTMNGKIFAMVVKGHGSLMNEWIAIDQSVSQRWRALIGEARVFVASSAAPKKRRPPA
jgi:hypothetical protein